MRLVFFGTPAFAQPTLAALIEAGHDVAAVYTRAPKPAGRRGLDLTPSPIHADGDRLGLPVRTPRTLRDEDSAPALAALEPLVAVVVGYGLLLPPPILAVPRHGCLNLHPSLLPRWRGAAPIQRAIMAGDIDTAVAVMRMGEQLDTGPIGLEQRIAIPPDATAGDMHDRLAGRGAALMVAALERLATGDLPFRAQSDDGIRYADKISKAEAAIDWARPATAVHDHIRGLSPFPGAYCMIEGARGPERLKVLRSMPIADTSGGPPGVTLDDQLTVACLDGAVRLVAVQRAGKAPMAAADFLRGTPVPAGTQL